MRCIERWHFQWPWRTPNLVFQGHGIFEVDYLKYRALYGQSFYGTLIGNNTQSIEWYHFQWPWVTSDTDFKVTTFFEVEYRKKWRVLKTFVFETRRFFSDIRLQKCTIA